MLEYSFVSDISNLVYWFADGRKSRRKARWKRKLMRDVERATIDMYDDEMEIIEEREWERIYTKRYR